ncbi:VOC family protein [Phytomonospora endophytica]|uniref:VOC domain-containing protein n=1 Tax=Phytomonospora endophytica TaxID=714109 RepID=A0A841FVI7_9ACTN|nr:hypothetical protein [Phytomonospora endophytica]MBB6036499.1 hypothetical protein [Phytomonospora endophytica]GIG65821.1 hypothetical protein Pen01_21160 [Phytomonospora endophytica]
MELLCAMYPVEDLDTVAEHYRALGFVDVARPDEDTLLLSSGEGPVTVMLERHPLEMKAGPGPVFHIDDVAAFHAEKPELRWLLPPTEIATGHYAVFADPAGNPVRLVDFTRDSGRYARLFHRR